MAIKQTDNGWKVDIRPEGTAGKRVIRKFRTKAEATRFEAFVIAQATAGKEWNPKPKSNQRLAELVEIWGREHGSTISSGWKYERLLEAFCKALGNPVARHVSSADISKWRSERLEVIKPQTCNRELTTVKSFFTWAIKQGYLSANPVEHIKLIKTHEQERPYLSQKQVRALYDAMSEHYDHDVVIIAQICLETGARWSEAQSLTQKQVYKDRIVFTETKSKKTRAVPIGEELSAILNKRDCDPLFRKCEHTARRWLNEILDLPKGISTHILRHTFASHFVMGGGNILTLQRILGHSKIEMTMRYAHLAPEHLEDAKYL
ncbi:MAG: hypothetical protein EP322_00280, partial [Bacteroidetes bacterium]